MVCRVSLSDVFTEQLEGQRPKVISPDLQSISGLCERNQVILMIIVLLPMSVTKNCQADVTFYLLDT